MAGKGREQSLIKSFSFHIECQPDLIQTEDFTVKGFNTVKKKSHIEVTRENCSPLDVNVLFDILDDLQDSTKSKNFESVSASEKLKDSKKCCPKKYVSTDSHSGSSIKREKNPLDNSETTFLSEERSIKSRKSANQTEKQRRRGVENQHHDRHIAAQNHGEAEKSAKPSSVDKDLVTNLAKYATAKSVSAKKVNNCTAPTTDIEPTSEDAHEEMIDMLLSDIEFKLLSLKYSGNELLRKVLNNACRKDEYLFVSLPCSDFAKEVMIYIKCIKNKKIPYPVEKSALIFEEYFDFKKMNECEAIFNIEKGNIIFNGPESICIKLEEAVKSICNSQESETASTNSERSIDVEATELSELSFTGEKTCVVVKIFKANIIELRVDVIVNAANGRLKHGGGVARAISNAAGEELEKDCKTFTHEGKLLKVTEMFPSSAGTLPCKKVYHAVGPKWENYADNDKHRCIVDLRHTILRCLVESSRQGIRSIAFPSISAAIFKVPKKTCAECYLKAVKHFDCLAPSMYLSKLEEISFVDIDDDMISKVQEKFSQSWKEKPNPKELKEDEAFMKKIIPGTDWDRAVSYRHTDPATASKETGSGVDPPNTRERFMKLMKKYDVVVCVGHALDMKTKSDLVIFLGRDMKNIGFNENLRKSNLFSATANYRSVRYGEFFKVRTDDSSPEEHPLILTLSKRTDLEDIADTFHNLHIVLYQCFLEPELKQIKSLILSSDTIYPGISDLDKKLVGKFAKGFYDTLENISTIQNLSLQNICIVSSPEAFDDIVAVLKSRNDVTSHSDRSYGQQQEALRAKTGNMPDGEMKMRENYISPSLNHEQGSIEIQYIFPSKWKLPNGTHNIKAYLPKNDMARNSALLLGLAFLRRQTFSVEKADDCDKLNWNGITHKMSTDYSAGRKYGYPDPTYLERLNAQLAGKGITKESMTAGERKIIEQFKSNKKISLCKR